MAGRRGRAAAIALCVSAAWASAALGQGNAGARAGLSWSATPGTLDLASPTATASLYVHFSGLSEFKGAEINLVWDPAGNTSDCAYHIGTLYKTGSDCSFLNRGTAVPIADADDPGHLHLAWANNTTSQCASGVGLVLQFAFDGCSTYSGCFALTSALVLDGASNVNTCLIQNGIVTVRGGGGGTCTPGSHAGTWGEIKSLFRR